MATVEVDGLRIAYERVGEGPALVLLHGYVGDGRTTWRSQLEELADDLTVVVWDAPGTGGSSDPPEDFGMRGFADCVASFLAEIGLPTAHVGGLSFGGALAIELYRRHPAMVKTLTLVSAYAGWAGSLPVGVAEQRLDQALGLASLPPEEFVETLLPTMFSEGTPPELVDEFGASMLRFHPVGFRAMARASAEDLSDALPDITVPTLLIYGDADTRAPLAVARDLHESIPGSTLVVLPDIGHLCSIEASAELNAALRRFLAEER